MPTSAEVLTDVLLEEIRRTSHPVQLTINLTERDGLAVEAFASEHGMPKAVAARALLRHAIASAAHEAA